MRSWMIYVVFILVTSINLFMLFKSFSKKKVKESLNDNIKKEVSYDLSREDKTEIVNLENKSEPIVQNKEAQEIFIPNLSDEDKTEISLELEEDMDVTIIDEIEEEPSVVYGKLEFTDGDEVREYEITKNEVIVGRDPRKSDLCIKEDNYLGRSHGKFLIEDFKVYFVDLESKNGSFLNGNRLNSKTEILDGMIIKLARTEIKFRK